jgi:phage terminase large subunit GpA-like protein
MPQTANIARIQNEINFLPAEMLRWRPPEQLLISQWIEKKRILSSDAEEKGPMRMRRTPYLIPIVDAFLDPDIKTIVICKAAQIGLTEGMISVIGYFADQLPGPAMIVMADEDTANYMSINRIRPMFRNSQNLAHLLPDSKFHKTEIYLSNGAAIFTGWASSVAKLASRPVQLMILDEVNKPGYYITTQESDPISLAYERTKAYFNSKVGMLSTPTVETGNITRELESCDIIFDWHIPCPFCKTYQPLRFFKPSKNDFPDGFYWNEKGEKMPLGQVTWQGGRNASEKQIEAGGYQCGSCEKIFDTIQKNIAVEKGKMIARKVPDHTPRKIGFHINRLYSLLGDAGYFPVLIRDWIKCLDSPKKKQGFYNSTLGDYWQQTILKSSEHRILQARADLDPQIVPAAAIALTAGIDPQKYGFWFVVRAWAKNYDSWLIHYGFLTNWDEVENLLFETQYPIAGSEDRAKPIWRACLDTGGGKGEDDFDPTMTEQAYWWLRSNAIGRGCYVYGIKGATRPLAGKIHVGKPLDQTPAGKPLPGGIRLIHIDTDQLKDQFHFRLENAINGDLQGSYLHRETGIDYAKQILAEEKVLNDRGIQEWIRIRRDNHFLDCECMAAIAADPEFLGGGINILRIREEKQQQKIKAQVEQKRKVKQKRDWREYRPKYLNR